MAHGKLFDTWETQKRRSSLRAKLLARGWNQLPLEAHYPGADFVWLSDHDPPRRIALQYKTPWDMVSSWWQGRLQRQLYDLTRTVEMPGLVIDGQVWLDRQTGGLMTQGGPLERNGRPVSYSTWTHIIAELTGSRRSGMAFHLFLLPGDMDYFVHWIDQVAAERFDQPEFAGWQRLELPPRHSDPRVQALLGFPGLGEQRAKDLLSYYGTVAAVLRAALRGNLVDTKTKRGTVRGIGLSTQARLQEVLNGTGT